MTRHRILTALVALIAVGVVAAVIYLERSNSGGQAATATTSSPTTSLQPTTLPTTTLPPTTVPPTTVESATVAPDTVPPTTLPPLDRTLVPVVVSSGPSNGDRLRPGALLLGAVGWTDIRALTGSVALTDTTVFYVDGLQAAAELLAADASVPLTAIAPMSAAPPVAGLANAQLLFYFGGS